MVGSNETETVEAIVGDPVTTLVALLSSNFGFFKNKAVKLRGIAIGSNVSLWKRMTTLVSWNDTYKLLCSSSARP